LPAEELAKLLMAPPAFLILHLVEDRFAVGLAGPLLVRLAQPLELVG
jgi:hypothetical protein